MNRRHISFKVCQLLRKVRRAKELTQADIADFLNLTSQQIANYEIGSSQLSIEKFILLSDFLKVDAVKILDFVLSSDDLCIKNANIIDFMKSENV
jgi:transcriptional regulator with XRE-family HTH domain